MLLAKLSIINPKGSITTSNDAQFNFKGAITDFKRTKSNVNRNNYIYKCEMLIIRYSEMPNTNRGNEGKN